MIKNVIQCDNCCKQSEEMSIIQMFYTIQQPKGWYVLDGEEYTSARHFCSWKCIQEFAAKQTPRNDNTTPTIFPDHDLTFYTHENYL